MTQVLAPTDSRLATFQRDLAKQYRGFTSLLPAGFPVERFARMAVNAVSGHPELADPAVRKSLWIQLNNCAALGLEPNTALHEASIVRHGNEVQLYIEYRAYQKAARQSGVVKDFYARTVYEGDKIVYAFGDDSTFHHEPAHPWSRKGAKAVGYYAYISFTNGGKAFVVWSKEEVEAHRDRYSKAYNFAESGPREKGGGKKNSAWHTAFDRQAEKTMIHQLSRDAPKEFQRLVAVDLAPDAGKIVRPVEGGELEIVDATFAEVETDTEKVVEEVAKAAAPAAADEKFDRRREELRTRPSPEGPVRTPTTAPVPAEKPAADEPEPPGPPEGFGIQAGDAYRVGYDRETNAIFMRGAAHPITSEPVRTNQGKAKEPLRCAWCGEVIPVGAQYYDGRRNIKACFRCFPEGTDAAEGPVQHTEEPPSPAEPEEEAPPVPTGVGPSKEARQAVLDAPELKAPTAAQGTITGDQLKALLSTAESGCPGKNAQERRDHWLIAVEREFPGIESAAEIPASGYLRAMRLAMGEG